MTKRSTHNHFSNSIWIPAFAGMTEVVTGMTEVVTGMTEVVTGMTYYKYLSP